MTTSNRDVWIGLAVAGALAVGGCLSTLSAQTPVFVLSAAVVAPLRLAASVEAQTRPTVRCPVGTVATSTDGGEVTCVPVTVPPPVPVNCVGAWGPLVPVGEWSAWVPMTGSVPPMETRNRPTQQTYTITTSAANGGTACEASNGATRPGLPLIETRPVVVVPPPVDPPPVEPPPTEWPIWPGPVTDAERLGTCTAAEHDSYLRSGGDGFRYWEWHPRQLPSGCWLGHEHGPNPMPYLSEMVAEIGRHEAAGRLSTPQANAARAAAIAPMLMGRVARLMPMPGEPNGHVEPHEGFKVFVASNRESNDENRVSRIVAVFMTHMGTGGVGRYTMPHHSVIGRQVHDTGAMQFTETMHNFGTANTVCNPRVSPTRDFIAILTSPCGIDSAYEIWTGVSTIRDIARTMSTPASFDPVTVMNRSNPSELVLAGDKRVLVTRNHDGDDWSGFRGCQRESYAQMPTYFRTGFFDVLTGPSGTDTGPLRQVLLAFSTQPQAVLGTVDGNSAFKVRRNHCTGPRLGLKN